MSYCYDERLFANKSFRCSPKTRNIETYIDMHSVEHRLIVALSDFARGRFLGTVNDPVCTSRFSNALVIVKIGMNSWGPQFSSV